MNEQDIPLYKVANAMIHTSKAGIKFKMIVRNKDYEGNKDDADAYSMDELNNMLAMKCRYTSMLPEQNLILVKGILHPEFVSLLPELYKVAQRIELHTVND